MIGSLAWFRSSARLIWRLSKSVVCIFLPSSLSAGRWVLISGDWFYRRLLPSLGDEKFRSPIYQRGDILKLLCYDLWLLWIYGYVFFTFISSVGFKYVLTKWRVVQCCTEYLSGAYLESKKNRTFTINFMILYTADFWTQIEVNEKEEEEEEENGEGWK
jgi:hypothetical protein